MAEQHTPDGEHAGAGARDSGAPVGPVELIEESVQQATVRRAPRVFVFLVAGAVLGAVVALVLTLGFRSGDGVEQSVLSAMSYTKSQVLGFLLLICVAAGVALGGAVAVILDATVGRRSRREVQVDRERVTTAQS